MAPKRGSNRPTPDLIRHRFGDLRAPQPSAETLDLIFGFRDFPQELEPWDKDLRNRYRTELSLIHRWELALAKTYFLPLKWAAYRLGMMPESLRSLLTEPELRARSKIDGLVGEDTLKVIKNFASEGFYSSDPNQYIERLHQGLQSRFKTKIEAAWCPSAKHKRQKHYGYFVDVLTGEPVSLQYQVWLDTNKPDMLRPDICGQKTFEDYREVLKSARYDRSADRSMVSQRRV